MDNENLNLRYNELYHSLNIKNKCKKILNIYSKNFNTKDILNNTELCITHIDINDIQNIEFEYDAIFCIDSFIDCNDIDYLIKNLRSCINNKAAVIIMCTNFYLDKYANFSIKQKCTFDFFHEFIETKLGKTDKFYVGYPSVGICNVEIDDLTPKSSNIKLNSTSENFGLENSEYYIAVYGNGVTINDLVVKMFLNNNYLDIIRDLETKIEELSCRAYANECEILFLEKALKRYNYKSFIKLPFTVLKKIYWKTRTFFSKNKWLKDKYRKIRYGKLEENGDLNDRK